MRDDPNRIYRFTSGPIASIAAATIAIGVLALVVLAFATGGNAFVIGTLLLLVGTGVSGLILERLDSSRSRGSTPDGNPEEHWGFRGRPGS